MSTQCGIAIKAEKGYKTIYVHSDGYPEYMWPMLTDWYGTQERAEALVSFGDASSIDKLLVPSQDSGHTFSHSEEGVCRFYHRDRGDSWSDCAPTTYFTKSGICGAFYYTYIWEDGSWHFYKGGRKTY